VQGRISAKHIGLIAGIIWFLVGPPLIKGYFLAVLTVLCYEAILTMSFRLIVIMGRRSLGHVAFMSVGAYSSALLSSKLLSLPFWLTLPLGGLVAAFVAFLISYPCLRCRGVYFVLSTYAVAQAIQQTYIRFRYPFGGLEGIGGVIHPNPIFGINFAAPVNFYYLAFGVALLSGFLMYWLEMGRLGDTVKATASSEDIMKSIGTNTWAYQSAFLAIASFFAGIAGVLHAHYVGFVAPIDFGTNYMFNVLAWNIIGGTGTFAGPLIGLVVVTSYTEAFRFMLEWVPFISGAIMIAMIMFFPPGIEGLPRQMSRWAKKKYRQE